MTEFIKPFRHKNLGSLFRLPSSNRDQFEINSNSTELNQGIN